MENIVPSNHNAEDEEVDEDEEEKNITFWVKNGHANYRAVGVKTLYNGRRHRKNQLTTVGHLVAAVKELLPSQLGSFDMNQLTLNTTGNGVVNETPLKFSRPLTSLAYIGTDIDLPLVIKKGKFYIFIHISQ